MAANSTGPHARAALLVRASSMMQQCADFESLVDVFQEAVALNTRFPATWVSLLDAERAIINVVHVAGSGAEKVRQKLIDIPVGGDPMVEEIVASEGPVVVVDARTDPRTNKEMVERFGNRTLIGFALTFLDKRRLIVNTGTFAPDPAFTPTERELELFTALGALLSVAAARLTYMQEQRAVEAERKRLEDQLLHAQKLESLGLLAGGIAHDFNNILAAILGNAELGLESADDEVVRQALHQVQVGALRARDLTGQMLAYAGKSPVAPVRLNLTAAATELMRLVQAAAPPQVQWRISGEPLGVEADGSQLRQVVLNLLTNAADAVSGEPTGCVEVEVHRSEQLGEGPWLIACEHRGPFAVLEVGDNGCGLDAETQQRMFDPFFSTKGPGRGLGMAAVQGIIQQHGGTLRVHSHPGEGARFVLALPEVPLSTEAPRQHTQMRPGRILVADDDEAVRSYLVAVLTADGHTVTEAKDGAQALRYLLDEPFDAAVLDVLMPRIVGPEVLKAARRAQRTVPTLLMSGFTQEHSVVGEPDVLFLAKPLGRDVFRKAMAQLLSLGTQ